MPLLIALHFPSMLTPEWNFCQQHSWRRFILNTPTNCSNDGTTPDKLKIMLLQPPHSHPYFHNLCPQNTLNPITLCHHVREWTFLLGGILSECSQNITDPWLTNANSSIPTNSPINNATSAGVLCAHPVSSSFVKDGIIPGLINVWIVGEWEDNSR